MDTIPANVQRRYRLAVVSTYDELCGIAGYTKALVPQLSEHFDVTVFDLDQFLLRSEIRSVRKMGDRHIREICTQFSKFDFVNLQLEFGTLGKTLRDILRRFRWIVAAAPALSVTFHTVPPPRYAILREIVGAALRFKFRLAADTIGRQFWIGSINRGVTGVLRAAQKRKPIRVIVHTRRDSRLMRYVHRIERVFDHPLVFLREEDAKRARASASRVQFPRIAHLSADSVLIGVFGFMGRYKGFETAIRALRHLPPNHHLLLFASVHPQEIRRDTAIDPYIWSLLDEARSERLALDRITERFGGNVLPPAGLKWATIKPVQGAGAVSLSLDVNHSDLLQNDPQDLSARIHFMGAQNDEAFQAGMAICDTVVLPYLEVGQSSSGPLSLAVELGCRVAVSRTFAFLQYGRYNPGRLEYFDIGNHLELASLLRASKELLPRPTPAKFTAESNIRLYWEANTPNALQSSDLSVSDAEVPR